MKQRLLCKVHLDHQVPTTLWEHYTVFGLQVQATIVSWRAGPHGGVGRGCKSIVSASVSYGFDNASAALP